ncbi:MAG: ankyrin repeat domain-containing protein, partial [Verrucomicrobiota bacterium]
MKPGAAAPQRLHHLDALRAAAMLLGIVYHAALSFALGFPWMVQDDSQVQGLFVLQAWVHGFRMQLFMLVSGFFTAMLWRRRGLKALLRQRCQRVLFPCLLGLVTVVPAMGLAVGLAASRPARPPTSTPAEPASASLWAAIRLDDLTALGTHLSAHPASLSQLHPTFGVTPLQWAALHGRTRSLTLLLDRGSPPNLRSREGHTALHGAAFMGHPEAVRLLLARGADLDAPSNKGETPLHNAGLDFGAVQYIAGLLALPVERAAWEEGRPEVRRLLVAAGARVVASQDGRPESAGRSAWNFLVHQPVFILIWFLWFLVWLL